MQPGRPGETDQLIIGLADEFDRKAEQPVKQDERANQLARFVARLRPPEQISEKRDRDEAFEPGLRSEDRRVGEEGRSLWSV
mgnify:CR=1 FL=1